MRVLIFAAVLLMASQAPWAIPTAQARPQQLPGGTYIYPEGTLGYYVGQYRSNYYFVPPVTNGFYGPPDYYNQGSRYYSPRYDYRNSTPMNYPGFYYQNPQDYWPQR